MVTSKLTRTIAAATLTGALLGGLSACGTPQTLKPYTPAEGVQVEIDNGQGVPLKVRNLMVITEQGSGKGFLAGAIMNPQDRLEQVGTAGKRVPTDPDALVTVAGHTLKADGTPVGQIAAVNANVELPPGKLVVLQNQTPVQIVAPDLTPGLMVELELTFKSGQTRRIQVPVVDGSRENYKDVKPASGGSATPGA